MRRRGNISRRCMAAIISAVMLMSTGAMAFPMGVYADTYYLENGSVTVEAKDDGSQYVTQADNNINSVEDADPVISTDDPNVEKNTLAADGSTTNTITISAQDNQEANVTLKDVNIDVSGTEDAKAVDTTGAGDVTIKLDGTNQVKSGENAAGIQKENTGSLTITDTPGTNDDSLNATGGLRAAGIGGGDHEEGSNITITGNTTIIATGVECGAGIGGGNTKDGSNIIISGDSTVTATSVGTCGAGIGGGNNGSGTNITIKDNATVTATGGSEAAGIGGGNNGSGTNIAIADNAKLTAIGGDNAAALGGGNLGAGTDITISGGEVNATGGYQAAGIGGGCYGTGTDITISGGEVNATGGALAAGIGGGFQRTGTDITISGGEVNATGGACGAGIGSGYHASNISSVYIEGNSTVIATGGNSAIDIDSDFACGGTGIGNGFNGVNAPEVMIKDSAKVYASPGKSKTGNPEAPAIGIAPHNGYDANHNLIILPGTEIPEANLLQNGFTGTLTTYEPGTTTAQIRAIVFPNSQPVTDPSGDNTSDAKTSDQNNTLSADTNNIENNDTDNNYTDNASSYQGITPAMLTRLINGLRGTSKAGVITIDFGRNICLTPEIMKILAETGNRAKNCSFIYKNKKYNLYIPIIDKNTNAYKDAMEVLKKEDNNRGFAGFMRVYEIYRDLGVTLQEIK